MPHYKILIFDKIVTNSGNPDQFKLSNLL